MNKKLFFNVLFIGVGSFVVFAMAAIIGLNFVKDSRLLAGYSEKQQAVNTEPQPTPIKARANETVDIEGNTGTVKYERAKDAVAATPKPTVKPTPTPGLPDVEPLDKNTPKPSGTAAPKSPEPSPGDAASSGKANPVTAVSASPKTSLMVEVINYSGKKDLAEKVRQKLEAAGYSVSAGNWSSSSPVNSQIVLRDETADSKALRSILNIGKVVKQSAAGSKYNVTVILGDDYQG